MGGDQRSAAAHPLGPFWQLYEGTLVGRVVVRGDGMRGFIKFGPFLDPSNDLRSTVVVCYFTRGGQVIREEDVAVEDVQPWLRPEFVNNTAYVPASLLKLQDEHWADPALLQQLADASAAVRAQRGEGARARQRAGGGSGGGGGGGGGGASRKRSASLQLHQAPSDTPSADAALTLAALRDAPHPAPAKRPGGVHTAGLPLRLPEVSNAHLPVKRKKKAGGVMEPQGLAAAAAQKAGSGQPSGAPPPPPPGKSARGARQAGPAKKAGAATHARPGGPEEGSEQEGVAKVVGLEEDEEGEGQGQSDEEGEEEDYTDKARWVMGWTGIAYPRELCRRPGDIPVGEDVDWTSEGMEFTFETFLDLHENVDGELYALVKWTGWELDTGKGPEFLDEQAAEEDRGHWEPVQGFSTIVRTRFNRWRKSPPQWWQAQLQALQAAQGQVVRSNKKRRL